MTNSNSKYLIEQDDLLKAAEGNWPSIFRQLTPSISDAVDSNKTTHFDCPFPENHDGSNIKKFRLIGHNKPGYQGNAICSCKGWPNGLILIRDINGWTYKKTLEEVNSVLNDPCNVKAKLAERDERISPSEKAKIIAEAEEKRKKREAEAEIKRNENAEKRKKLDDFYQKTLHKTWAECITPTSSNAKPLHRYLRSRCIPPAILNSLNDIMFHPNLPHYLNGEELGSHPAMIALIRDRNGDPLTIHRTYLSNDGEKAKLPNGEKAKQVLPAPSTKEFLGGAIQVMPKGRILGVAEGIETALSVIAARNIPCWPTYSDSMLANLNLDFVDKDDYLLIWADKDRSFAGEKAAKTLEERALEKGIKCKILLPSMNIPDGKKGLDWNDVLMYLGENAFPKLDYATLFEANDVLRHSA
jgi:hypothetical protein